MLERGWAGAVEREKIWTERREAATEERQEE